MVRMFRETTKMNEHKSPKRTRQSRTRNIATSTMNKHQKRMRGKSRYRGQGH